MIKVIIILILFCLIGFLIGRFVVLNYTKSILYKRTNKQDVSPDRECEGGVCPPPKGYEKGGE